MRAKVTDQGVVIPKQWLEGIDEVEIRQEQDVIVVVPVTDADPIRALGTDPLMIEVDDASINHDHYLYGA